MNRLTSFGDDEKTRFLELYGRDFSSTEQLFAYDITNKLGDAYNFTEAYLFKVVTSKPVNPDSYGYGSCCIQFCQTVQRIS